MKIEEIGKYLSVLRKEKNMTQDDLAEKLGVSNKTISRWETGKNIPDINYLNDLCKIYDITLNDLIAGEEKNDKVLVKLIKKNKTNLKFTRNILIILSLIILALIYIVVKICYYDYYRDINMNVLLDITNRQKMLDEAKTTEMVYSSICDSSNNYQYYDLNLCGFDESLYEYKEVLYLSDFDLSDKSYSNGDKELRLFRYSKQLMDFYGYFTGEPKQLEEGFVFHGTYLDLNTLLSSTMMGVSLDYVYDISVFSSFKDIKKYYNFFGMLDNSIKNIEYVNFVVMVTYDDGMVCENRLDVVLFYYENSVNVYIPFGEDVYIMGFINYNKEEIMNIISGIKFNDLSD